MAINATQILYKHIEDLRLNQKQCEELCDIATYIEQVEDSIELDKDKTPKIILSASGMASGGRIIFHIQAYAADPLNTLLFTGFQAEGTLGAGILKGKKYIEAHGKIIPINAQVEAIRSTSAHADYGEILGWLKQFTQPPKKTFVTHGEPEAALSLKHKIETQLGWTCIVPEYGQEEQLS
jgi:metallo-beta-lactamase family protein